jgi:hypothetical protein
MRVAKEGFEAEIVEQVMLSELCTVVEGQGSAHCLRHGLEQIV